ncbi:NucA/NucB deoxyribonuclease domain-containing protein [Streptomyces sp. NPDC047072]|uniref:NucA/NucB deoxyribonuclease domain-containing protein n=1 Tax=Streptomyces sp. NPDC047072 TaxID=3154809 RepID=UPI003410CA27
MRLRMLLASGAATLGLLGSCLSIAQAAEEPTSGPDVAVQASQGTVPAPGDLDESSEELDDELSEPVPEVPEDEVPSSLGDTPGDESTSEDDVGNPDPMAAAENDRIRCTAKILAAKRDGSEELVPCVSFNSTASAAELRAAVDAWPTPSWCDDHGANGQWYVNRFKACGVFAADLTVTNPRTGAVVGRMHYLTVAYAYSKRDIKTWAYQVQLLEVSSSGVAKGSSVGGKATCAGKCKVTESKFPSQLMGASRDPVGQFFLDTTIKTSPKGQKGEGQASAVWQFTNPQWSGPTNSVALPTPPVRCDNALPGTSKTGCVMPYIPDMVYAKSGEFPELAKHIEYAQTTKNLPGKHGTKRYLTRLTNKDKITKNRNTACPSSLERPAGKQCDEYPFASTWQGASTGGDFSRRMINATQNEDGGRALSRFYLYNRIIEKDRFLVWIK